MPTGKATSRWKAARRSGSRHTLSSPGYLQKFVCGFVAFSVDLNGGLRFGRIVAVKSGKQVPALCASERLAPLRGHVERARSSQLIDGN
jgi:hypothetical protein